MGEFRTTSDMDVRLVDSMGDDSMICSAARVASVWGPDHVLATDQNEKLIGYLMKHRHGSPFEHGAMTFRISAPIFVWREFHRHRIGFSYNEISARYKAMDPLFWIPRRSRAMVPVDGWKPMQPKFLTLNQSVAKQNPDFDDDEVTAEGNKRYNRLVTQLTESYKQSFISYTLCVQYGIALEVSRTALPFGLYSQCWVTCNPRSLMAFLSLRTHRADAAFVSYPQAEIEEVAEKMELIFAGLWPLTYIAFNNNGRVGP